MNRLSKKIVSLVVTVMMLASAFLMPGMFNFSRVSAEDAPDLLVRFSNNKNLIASIESATLWKNVQINNDGNFAVLENVEETIQIEFSDWDLKDSTESITVKITSTGVVLKNIVINYTQSQGGGGGIAVNGGEEVTVIGNNLNFLSFSFDVYPIYTLNYITNISELTVPSQSFIEGDEINPIPNPNIEGLTFDGWFVDGDFTQLFNNFGSMPANNVTVYGKWTEVVDNDPQPELFTLTYVTNTESVSYDDVSFEEGQEISPENPTQEGFTFDGWFADSDLTTEFTSFGSMPAQNVTVFGKWTEVVDNEPQPELFNVIYFVWNDQLEEFEEVNRDEYEEGQSIVRFDVDGRQGFTFDGWYTMAQPIFTQNVEINDNRDIVALPILIDNPFNLSPFDFDDAVMGTSDIELYGRFVQVVAPVEFVIDFIIVGEENEVLESRTFDFEEGIGEIPTPTQEGFTFNGWFMDEELTIPVNFDTLLNAEMTEYTVYGSWVIDEEPVDEEPVDEDPVDEDPVDEEPVDEEPVDEEPVEEELEDDGEVLGDSDEKEEVVEETTEETELEDDGEVLGDSDQLPEMNDTNYVTIALFFLIIGLLTVVATKPEQEIV